MTKDTKEEMGKTDYLDYLDYFDEQIKGWQRLGVVSMFGLAASILFIIIMILFF